MKLETLALHAGYESERRPRVPRPRRSTRPRRTPDNTQHGADLFDPEGCRQHLIRES